MIESTNLVIFGKSATYAGNTEIKVLLKGSENELHLIRYKGLKTWNVVFKDYLIVMESRSNCRISWVQQYHEGGLTLKQAKHIASQRLLSGRTKEKDKPFYFAGGMSANVDPSEFDEEPDSTLENKDPN
jgi:hypothetical protein